MSWKALAFGGADAAAAAGPSLDSNLDQYGDVIGTFGEDGTFVQDNRARADAAAAAEPEPEFVPLQMALAQQWGGAPGALTHAGRVEVTPRGVEVTPRVGVLAPIIPPPSNTYQPSIGSPALSGGLSSGAVESRFV